MVLQVKYGFLNGSEDHLPPQLPNQRQSGSENAPRNQQQFRNDGVHAQVCTNQRLHVPEYFLHGATTRSGPDGNGRNDISQRTVSTTHETTVSPALKRTLLLEDTGKELRRVADMYIVTRNTGHELRRIADAIICDLGLPFPADDVFIEEVCDDRRRKNS